MSESLLPHGLQHARLPCPSLSLTVYSNSGPLSQWCHPTISSSVTPFSSCLQSFPASESFPMSQLFATGEKSIRASASTYISQMEKPTLTETKLIFQIPKVNVTKLFWPLKFISRVNALWRQSQPLFLNFIHRMPQMRRGSYSNDCWSEVDSRFGYQSLGM